MSKRFTVFLFVVSLAAVPLLAGSAPTAVQPGNSIMFQADDIKVDVDGVTVSIDRVTGRMRNLPTEQARQLQAAMLRAYPVTATQAPQTTATGALSIALDERNDNYYIASFDDGGNLQFSCVNSLGDVTATMLRAGTALSTVQHSIMFLPRTHAGLERE